ncbi:uncharacterized protein LOC127750396 [Frankliniella occidentalis]|uniref:Uncharacterized protein LOC127750396 n=1 Tax=Frankliniella occidentalis TaxID=133901 RepID=A0A9C6XQT6_FRAOC|nr:uncharacterized protein LOC127750396 [Frankliniella occidentalis]
MQEVGETGGDWSLSPAWQRMSSLLTQLDSHVLERKLRLCQAALRPGPVLADCEEQVKLDLRHFEVDGSVTFNLSCLHCSGRGRDWDREDDDDDDTCVDCQGSGRHAPVVLDLAPYHPALDEAQLIARFLAMVVFRGGQGVLEGAGDGTAALPEKASSEAAVPELVWALDGEVLDEEDEDDELRELELVQLQVWEEGLQEQEQWAEEPVELQVREADLDQPRVHEEVGEEDEEEDERRREELREQLQVWEELRLQLFGPKTAFYSYN